MKDQEENYDLVDLDNKLIGTIKKHRAIPYSGTYFYCFTALNPHDESGVWRDNMTLLLSLNQYALRLYFVILYLRFNA